MLLENGTNRLASNLQSIKGMQCLQNAIKWSTVKQRMLVLMFNI